MYERILVPTDGSAGAGAAAEEAMDLADEFGATLYALYVVDASSVPSAIEAAQVTRAMEESGREATEDLEAAAEDRGIDVEIAVRHGVVYRTIVDHAEEHGIDLIVMGTHGRQGIERYLLGSVTEKVVRTADVPVLTVHQAEE